MLGCIPAWDLTAWSLQVVLSRQYGSEGRFTFTSHTPGEHQICLHSNSTRMALFAGGKLVTPGGAWNPDSWVLSGPSRVELGAWTPGLFSVCGVGVCG